MRRACGVTHPRLYVYDIPESYRRKAPSIAHGFPAQLPRRLRRGTEGAATEDDFRIFPAFPPVELEPLRIQSAAALDEAPRLLDPPPLRLRNTSQYSGAGVVWLKVLRYPCRTTRPAEADLFFVPVFNEKDGIVTYRKGNKGFRDIMCRPGSLWIKKACRRSALVELLEQVGYGAQGGGDATRRDDGGRQGLGDNDQAGA